LWSKDDLTEEEHMAEKRTGPPDAACIRATAAASIEKLIAGLASEDGPTRVRARQALVAAGEPAVGHLVRALRDRKEWVRWEAAKSLGQIGSPSATQALVDALEDKMFDVRWMSAEGLITIGRSAVAPLLHALLVRADSIWLREGVHHVLHGISGKRLREITGPVIAALESVSPATEVPFVAKQSLDALGHGGIH
jgi:HEAT repeat protein